MAAKESDFVEQMKKQLDDLNYRWNIERNKLEAKAQHESAEAKKMFEKKRGELRKYRQEMKEKIKDLEVAGENAWDNVKDGAEDAWKVLAAAFEDAASHFKK